VKISRVVVPVVVSIALIYAGYGVFSLLWLAYACATHPAEPAWHACMVKACQYCEKDNYAETEQWLGKATEAQKSGNSPDHWNQLFDCAYPSYMDGWVARLADIYAGKGKYDRAESLLNQAIRMRSKKEDTYHCYEDSLARLYESQGKHSDAELLYKKLLATDEQSYKKRYTGWCLPGTTGPWQPLTFTTFDLGDCYQAQGKLSEAEAVYKRGLQVEEEDDGITVRLKERLLQVARFYSRQGKHAEAEKLEARARAIR
jgi:tetratricopeptide (TPR) repeat protein